MEIGVHQSEWASDVMFTSRADLQAIYARLVRHALATYDSACVLRFLGRALAASGQVRPDCQAEVHSDGRRREEGLRVKHSVNGNAVKAYDKGSVLRIETTINEAHEFKVYRAKEGDPDGQKDWRVLRKAVADLRRRAEVSQGCNERYAEALAAVHQKTALGQLAEPLSQRAVAPGKGKRRHVRGLSVLSAQDGALLRAVASPEFVVNGLRNKDVAKLLYDKPARDAREGRRRASRVTRQLRMLRAHGLLRKVPRSHRYQVSEQGRKTITVTLAAIDVDAETLTAQAT